MQHDRQYGVKTYGISMDDKNAAWYGLGCIYTDVAKFVAENPLAKSKRWETNRWHDTTHPYDFLEQAICCFSRGSGFRLADHYAWYCERRRRDTSDLDQLSIEIGLELKESARKMAEEGTSGLAMKLAFWDLSHGHNMRAKHEVHHGSTYWNEACCSMCLLFLLGFLVTLL